MFWVVTVYLFSVPLHMQYMFFWKVCLLIYLAMVEDLPLGLRILVPCPGMECPLAMQVQSLGHWTTREVQCLPFYSLFIKAYPVSHPLISLSRLSASSNTLIEYLHPFFRGNDPFTRYKGTLRQTIPLITVWTWESIDRNFRPCDKLVLVTAQTKPGPVACTPGSSASRLLY